MNTTRSSLLLLALLLPLAGCKQELPEPRPANVRVAVAHASTIDLGEQGPTFLGAIRGDTETALSFKVYGRLEAIGPGGSREDWKQGARVRAGEVLARLDRTAFLNAAAAARARADLARANFARNSDLYGASNLSKSEFDASRAQKEMADAEFAQAEESLRDTVLRAPYDGVVLARLAESGEFAAAGHPVLLFGDLGQVSLEVGVPDTVVGHVSVGSVHTVVVSAFEGAAFRGAVSEVGIAADKASRLYRVVLKIPNADGRLKSGMTASVRLGGREGVAKSGFLVPLSALVSQPSGGVAVFVVDAQGHARLRPVPTSDIVRSSVLVTDGLSEGDRIVVLGAGQLADGEAVRVLPSEP